MTLGSGLRALHRSPPGKWRLPHLVVAGALLFTSGCGRADDAAPSGSSTGPSAATDKAAVPATPSATTIAPSQGAARAMGVDVVRWPTTIAAAKPLFKRMPDRIAGWPARRPDFFGPTAGVVYGPGDRGATAYAMSTDKQVKDPTAVLAFMFGMGLACKKGSYAGTAPSSQYGGGPDIDRHNTFDPNKRAWWFSCTIDGAEGDPKFTGHALGWVSGDLGWLVTTPKPRITRAVAAALIATREG